MRKKGIVQSRVFLVLIVIIAAFLAAFVGQLVTSVVSNRPSLSPESFIIRESDDSARERVSIAREIREGEVPGFVELYQQTTAGLTELINGIVLTNDGWAAAIAPGSDFTPTHLRTRAGDLFEIDQTVRDSASPLVFVHVQSGTLHPVTLAESFSAEVPDEVYLAGPRDFIQTAQYIGDGLRPETVLSSARRNQFPLLSQGSPGMNVYNADAELTGLVSLRAEENGHAYVLSADFLRSALDQVLRNGGLVRPDFNVNYIDLADTPVRDPLLGTSGAWISRAASGQQGLPQSAVAAGLQYGDVIASVEGRVVNHRNTLSSYILEMNPGDTVQFGILRNGEPMSLEVELPEADVTDQQTS